MNIVNRIMSALGYVPLAEAAADIGALLALVADTQALAESRAKLIDAMVADRIAIAAAKQAPLAAQFATAELVADETPVLTLAELRKQTTLLEVLAKQGDQVMLFSPATGASASGLPG